MSQAISDRNRMMLVWPVAGFFVVIAFGVGLVSMAAFDSGSTAAPGTTTAAAAAAPQTLDVELGDLYIKPAKLEAQPGPLTVMVHNAGKVEHNFDLGKLGVTPMIQPGKDATLQIDSIAAGNYAFQCDVPGHASAGMSGTLHVSAGGASSDTGAASSGMGSMGGMTGSPEHMAEMDAANTAKFPEKTKGVGGRVLEPQVLPDGTKVFELTASPIKWEVASGEVKDAWAYNGMIPGPQIEADLGDRVRIVLHNELPEPTTIHFHGMTVPNAMDGVPGITQDAVLPGDSFTYEFTIRNSGTNMYHSHFDAVKQVPMGLLGAFIVRDPADPDVAVDQTIVLNDGPMGFTLNGKSFPATAPIVANEGDWVRIRYMNEGSMIHPMHLHGMPSKVIAKDGHLLAHPYLADTILVGPGERYDVLVHATELGAWALHCHILAHAEGPNGMFGMVTALIVE